MGCGATAQKYEADPDPSKTNGDAGTPNGAAAQAKKDPPSPPASGPEKNPPPPGGPPQAVQDEILAVMRVVHAPQLRHLPRDLWPRIASSAIFEEIPAGTVKEKCWDAGTCIILSGSAAIVMQFDGVDLEVARLHEGDAYGWHPAESSHFADDEEGQRDECLWKKSAPRVIVDGGGSLRIAHVTKDFLADLHRTAKEAAEGKMGNHAEQVAAAALLIHLEPELHSRLGSLWLMASAPKVGLCTSGGLMRAHFLSALWLPLYDLFEKLNEEMHWRHKIGYRVQDRFPLLGHQIIELKDHVMHLTSIWYGADRGGNLSAYFRWFMEAMEICGVTAYKWEIIPTERTPDKWGLLVDQAPRAAALKAKAAAGGEAVKGASQKQGRSAIDNTVLRNVFTRREARELLVGRRLRQMVTLFIRLRQQIILRRLSKKFQLDLYRHASVSGMGHGHREVQFVLSTFSAEELAKLQIDQNGLCYKMLVKQGGLLQTCGQLDKEDQPKLQAEISRLLGYVADDATAAPRADATDDFERFVAWCRDKPGEFFDGEKWKHTHVKIAGLWNDQVVVVRRSAMEKFTNARFFPIAWTRTQPLWAVTSSGPVKIRSENILESSSVRVNECPYAHLHGMSLSGAGFASDEKPNEKRKEKGKRYGILMELQWIKDPNAAIENWGLTDIEKIVQETWNMNPHGIKEHNLPGEGFVYVGQNPKVGSSIKATQHTQLSAASALDYPFFSVSTNPVQSAKLNATIDLVDVGPNSVDEDKRGCLIKVVSRTPTNPDILAILVQLRLLILQQFGGSEAIDFLCGCASDEQGSFITLFVPIAQLQKVEGVWTNPLTKETQKDVDLDEPRIDYGKGVGHYLQERPELKEQCWKSGEEYLRRVYAFNRIPGCRAAMAEFIKDKL